MLRVLTVLFTLLPLIVCRAMMKSFVESNGTVLSTNWKEVGAKKIECTPPEGAELHKWSENM